MKKRRRNKAKAFSMELSLPEEIPQLNTMLKAAGLSDSDRIAMLELALDLLPTAPGSGH
jgi:hypothetical protein